MKRLAVLFFLLVLSADLLAAPLWGFFAHRLINRHAVYIVPSPLFGFYKKNIDYLTEHAVDADKRRYIDHAEACRHYLDTDHYEESVPIDTIPHYWSKAVEKYTEDTLRAYGIVPWHIGFMMARLTKAFEQKNVPMILRLSADMGHYIADCHVPLHSTKNYNGQLTNQVGIHAFWESRIPELFYGGYDLFTGKAEFIENPQKVIWQRFEESFAAKDSVLYYEQWLTERFGEEEKYSLEQRGNSVVKVYSKEFSVEYNAILGEQVERRFKSSIKTIGDIWYTCWVNAGMPDLEGMDAPPLSDEDRRQLTEEEDKFRQGEIMGRDEPH